MRTAAEVTADGRGLATGVAFPGRDTDSAPPDLGRALRIGCLEDEATSPVGAARMS